MDSKSGILSAKSFGNYIKGRCCVLTGDAAPVLWGLLIAYCIPKLQIF